MYLLEITLACVLLMAYGLSKTRSRRRTPKERPAKRPSRRDNVFKQHLKRYPFETTENWCKRAAVQNAECKSDAGDALCAALRGLGIRFRIEERVTVHGRNYFCDVWLLDLPWWFECDGAQHKATRLKDMGRDEDIAAATGRRVCRQWNAWYLRPGLQERILIEIGRK